MPEVRRVAILDDYQQVARQMAEWHRVTDGLGAEVTTFHEHLGGPDDVVAALEPFDALVVMRERTAFPAEVLERLPNLRLLVTTGPANAAIDVAAAHRAGDHGVGDRRRHEQRRDGGDDVGADPRGGAPRPRGGPADP